MSAVAVLTVATPCTSSFEETRALARGLPSSVQNRRRGRCAKFARESAKSDSTTRTLSRPSQFSDAQEWERESRRPRELQTQLRKPRGQGRRQPRPVGNNQRVVDRTEECWRVQVCRSPRRG